MHVFLAFSVSFAEYLVQWMHTVSDLPWKTHSEQRKHRTEITSCAMTGFRCSLMAGKPWTGPVQAAPGCVTRSVPKAAETKTGLMFSVG